jgi:hypothetical protein
LAITGRLYEFPQDHGGTPEEKQALKDALAGLTVLRREVAARAKAPDSSEKPKRLDRPAASKLRHS